MSEQNHCFKCGARDSRVRLNPQAWMIGHMIPGWQNEPEICNDPYHDQPEAQQRRAWQRLKSLNDKYDN